MFCHNYLAKYDFDAWVSELAVVKQRVMKSFSKIKFAKILALFAACLLVAQAQSGVFAQSNVYQNHIFSVYDIDVDVTSTNARAARLEALNNAQLEGFWRLLRKISLEDHFLKLPTLDAVTIRDFVSGIEVHDERTSARRYIATLDISYNKSKIIEFLGAENLPYTELTGGPLLLLPVYEYGGVFSLFEGNNPWLNAMFEAGIDNHLYKFIKAKGDFEDILLLGDAGNLSNNLNSNQTRLRRLNDKYAISDVLFAQVWWAETNENGLKNLNFKYGLGLSPVRHSGVIVATVNDTPEIMFEKAAQAIFGRLDIAWRQQTLTTFGAFNEIKLHVSAQTAVEWSDILDRLKTTPIVRDVTITKLSVPVSDVIVTYAGVFEQLRLVLEGINLNLVEEYDGWYLEIANQAPPN